MSTKASLLQTFIDGGIDFQVVYGIVVHGSWLDSVHHYGVDGMLVSVFPKTQAHSPKSQVLACVVCGSSSVV